MNRFFRALIAGYGAKKLGGGCFSTILIFIVIYWALGKCNSSPQTRHTEVPVKTQSIKTASHSAGKVSQNSVVFLYK
jgi:hypothetical protein